MANIEEIEAKVSQLCESANFGDEFIYELILAYGVPKATIARIKKGNTNLINDDSGILWKKKVYFKPCVGESLHLFVDDAKDNPEITKHHVRFIIATDEVNLVAIDTKTDETLDISLKDLAKHFTFFLPLAGMEKSQVKTENIADRKAAEKMAKLYDEIQKSNHLEDKDALHSLNVFFSRLLFCFFAEDTDVFQKGQFVNSISSHTQEDGSDLNVYLDRLFEAFDEEDKSSFPEYIRTFPYINGGLFSRHLLAPTFTAKARQLIIDCGELNWSKINPDIFGSMMQAVVHHSQRASLGMHYTSVTNIMKVIDPLFMDDLHQEFEKAFDSEKKLEKLWGRISEIKIFDPACGSGNFLIIAYKEFRKLEHKIIARIQELQLQNKKADVGIAQQWYLDSKIKLENFYGIEIEEFAQEVAILSLWIAKHQMNIEFRELFGPAIPLVPLKDAGNIVCANAAQIEWNDVCENDGETEIYLIGNPPYGGSRKQNIAQKNDMDHVFSGTLNKYRDLDYISIWFYKGAKYISRSECQLAFVTTNSITQGEQVSMFWPYIFNNDVEIGFGHRSFKWGNSAKGNAGVTVIIISLRVVGNKQKYIFEDGMKLTVKNVNPYLKDDGQDRIITRRNKVLSLLPPMLKGNQPTDDGNLLLSKTEKETMISKYPKAMKFMRRIYGASEYLNGIEKWCLWLDQLELSEASAIPDINERIEKVKRFREASNDPGTQKKAKQPYKFRESRTGKVRTLLIPSTTSERRKYIPIGFLTNSEIATNAALVVYDPDLWLFGLLTSRMHMVWTRAVAGRLKTDYRYSSALVYNNFPVRPLTDGQKKVVTEGALRVLAIREKYPEKTLAQLYDPDKMPADLKAAHEELDEIVDGLYSSKGFANDEERLSMLFDLYEKMIAEEKGELNA